MYALDLIQPAIVHTWSTDGPGEWWWLWRLFMFLIWIAVIFLIIRFVARGRCWRHGESSPTDRARGVLAERYARGEIDEEEYRKRSETLR